MRIQKTNDESFVYDSQDIFFFIHSTKINVVLYLVKLFFTYLEKSRTPSYIAFCFFKNESSKKSSDVTNEHLCSLFSTKKKIQKCSRRFCAGTRRVNGGRI